MKFFASTALAAAIGIAQVSTTNIRVARDATVSFSGIICDNGQPCSSIPLGLEKVLTSFKGNRDFERILLGFDLPANPITKCVLKIPHPIEAPTIDSYELRAAVTDNDWSENTVNGLNKKNDATTVGSVLVQIGLKPGDIDVTRACQIAHGGSLSLFVDSSGPMTSFESIQSGSSAVFSLDATY